jgi:hypothetical protein
MFNDKNKYMETSRKNETSVLIPKVKSQQIRIFGFNKSIYSLKKSLQLLIEYGLILDDMVKNGSIQQNIIDNYKLPTQQI